MQKYKSASILFILFLLQFLSFLSLSCVNDIHSRADYLDQTPKKATKTHSGLLTGEHLPIYSNPSTGNKIACEYIGVQ